ncbi:hypothetical protein DQ04_00021200 [Trypanosoma grayi]|uniref:hypothetical protein n=1 Tax=Trypanosoma grayi TaxID=71804 RepID=UPI0004F48E97|nr:hypothetical protein DQ04_00021200 [Trypanosoma grayi]KEG15622.1 hypothetical protein DQ04_00021200 [Trypanosoma grayi]
MAGAWTDSPVTVCLDRVGGAYVAGETVTGCVVVNYTTASAFVSIELSVLGSLVLQHPNTDDAARFAALGDVEPVGLMNLRIPLHSRGALLPAGRIEFPFTFEIHTSTPGVSLIETYSGVYISCSYTITVTASGIVGKVTSEPLSFPVSVPGQGQPPPHALKDDTGVQFELNEDSMEVLHASGRALPSFLLEGSLERYYNDIDIPLSGWIVVRRCSAKIVSIELQLLRVEQAAVPGASARGATEVQSIQVADGDVLRNLEIPIYMFFPRWYTCPSIKTANMRVAFDVNVILLLEGNRQLSKVVPIHLYRASLLS